LLGRSHRSKPAKAQLAEVIERSHTLLGLPDDWRLAIVPASDTGAVEMAIWNLVGEARGVEVLAWESFSEDWATDIIDELQIAAARVHRADWGQVPDLSQVDFSRDVVFAWNGTTSGVCLPDGDWIPDRRDGLMICDATSAAFAMPLPFAKLDVVTWSWQKVLGGEAAHGMLALSPRAIERLESEPAPRPLPKLFRLTKKGRLDDALFNGATINTPSMLAVADCLEALDWAERIGGLDALIARTRANFEVVDAWLAQHPHFRWLPEVPATRSTTALCLKFHHLQITAQPIADQQALAAAIVNRLAEDGIAYDIAAYRTAPPGLRIWGGATVQPDDTKALLPWIDQALAAVLDRN
jgi:phosphoserine aminotransferase